jgi:hypothetical protein
MENTIQSNRKFYMGSRIMQKIGWIVGGIILAVFLAFIFGYFVMLLWNWIMPLLFGLPQINYWMGFGIIILARLIFGGFGHGGPHHKYNHHDRYYGSKFRNRCRPPIGHHNKWTHYDDYWKEEGEEAFDRYIERKNANDSGKEMEKPAN